MADEECKVFLYLAIAHVGTVHDLGLTGAILTNLEHIPNNLYIRSPLFHTVHYPQYITIYLLLKYYLTIFKMFVNRTNTIREV